MQRTTLSTTWLLVVSIHLATVAIADDESTRVNFNRDIRPILSANCYACHGPDEEAREADLRLDHFEGATESEAVVPGDLDASELISRIETDDEDELMPPADTGHRLTAKEKALLRAWITAGGTYDEHWAFIAPEKKPLPQVMEPDWASNEIDRFILARIEKAGLAPSAQANPYQLLRRLSLDLTGLPPSIDEAEKFAADPSPKAYAAAVDRLLASDRFGEHWARMWLDLARYADTQGYEKDRPRTIWRYRDWVIDALNRDIPFDEFTLHQLAGDLLPNPNTDQILATAFHRNTLSNEEGGTDDEEFRVAAVKDRVDTTIQVWMGLTMGCAKCHTHKYDPISIEDYYAVYAVFNQTEDADRGDESPTMKTPTREQAAHVADLENQIAALKSKIDKIPAGYESDYAKWEANTPGDGSLWEPLTMNEFKSRRGLEMKAGQAGTLVATGEKPADDDWELTVLPPNNDRPITALRLDLFPPSQTKSDWKEGNVTIQFELELVAQDAKPTKIKFKNARSNHQQRGWDVQFAVDDKSETGWAVAGREKEHNVAIFDLSEPLTLPHGAELRFKIDFPNKNHHVVSGFRFSITTLDPSTLKPELDPVNRQDYFFRSVHPETRQLFQARDKLASQLAAYNKKIPSTPIMRAVSEEQRRENHVHLRGNFLDQAKETVTPAVPPAFGTLTSDAPPDRVAVAKWLCSENNPLTARVMTNRVWSRLFGIGIVETEEDFGSQGTFPSHPELLDWLAVDYRDGGWSLKSLLRTIVSSSTYRQSSLVTEQALAADPRNRLLARGPRFRLSAETIRDQSLAVSGLLTEKVGGPSVFPPQPPGVWKSTYSDLEWKDATDENRYRRALYTFLKRTSPHPAMTAFDAGSGEVCQIRRIRTNTPLQPLITLNDPAYLEAAGALAVKMAAASDDLSNQIAHGFQRVLIRKPHATEIAQLVKLHASLSTELEHDPFLASAGLKQGDPALVAVASVILNLDETLMKP